MRKLIVLENERFDLAKYGIKCFDSGLCALDASSVEYNYGGRRLGFIQYEGETQSTF